MINNWKKFNESNNLVSYEILSEIILFRNNSLLNDNEKLHRQIDTFIEIDLDEDVDELTPITKEEHRMFQSKVESLIERIKKDSKLVSTLNSLYTQVEERMKGLPKFYELEDIFLDLTDEGWIISFLVSSNERIEIEITNEMSNLQIDYGDYLNLQLECSGKLKRLTSLHSNICEIVNTDFTKQYDKNVGSVKIQLRVNKEL